MDQPITFNVPQQLSHEGVRKSGEISSAFTALQRTITGAIGNTPDIQLINQKLQEAWALTNHALVTMAGRVAA